MIEQTRPALTTHEMAIERRITRTVDIIFKPVKDLIYLESTATFNKQTQNGYKMARIKFTEEPTEEGEMENECEILQSIASVNPKLKNIVSLTLSHCNLPNIPISFCVLSLRILDLSFNLLRAVPKCIENGLVDLEELNLSHNNIGKFHKEPKCSKTLIVLNLDDNNLQNIPIWILRVKCPKLQVFYYSGNTLTSLKKSQFELAPRYSLTKLYLRNCYIIDSDFRAIKTIRTLKTLDLGNIGNTRCNSFEKIETLFDEAHFRNYIETLSLINVSLPHVPENIIRLKYLQKLDISRNVLSFLSDCIIDLLHLKYLNVGYNMLTRLPDDFYKLEHLEVLIAPYNFISCLPVLNTQTLRHVDLYKNEISFFDLNVDNLQMADFEQNFFDTTQLPINYTQCLNAFRSNNKTDIRLLNERLEDNFSSTSSNRSFESEHSWHENNFNYDHIDETVCDNDKLLDLGEEERWDDAGPVIKSATYDITLSDSEWDGKITVKKTVRKKLKKTEVMEDHLFEDID